MKTELNHTLEENFKLKEMLNPHLLSNMLLKVVGNLSVKKVTKSNQGIPKKRK